MAAAMAHCVSCWGLPAKLKTLSLTNSPHAACKPLSFSSNTSSLNLFSRGVVSVRPVQMSPNRRSIVCEAGTKKKADSAAKRARQAEKRRVYHKAKKSEVRTRMKKKPTGLNRIAAKICVVLKGMSCEAGKGSRSSGSSRKKSDAQPEEVLPVEKLIAEAYSVIDKAVKVGTLHRNTGARRKSRLARRKKAVEIQRGWYTPAPEAAPTA
ncbi:hypothetical protein DH2020_033470 [Rehmannia glutinosa]|uniref:30S ribosomal protein n=1 Tax=Rehmannia glutinosa TaxID=99300 RepID=A0ABR0VFL4_REHGL